MTVYKVSWELIDGIDGKIRGVDYFWFESENELDKEFFEDMLSETVEDDIRDLPNFHQTHLESIHPETWSIRSVKIDKIRKGDIVKDIGGIMYRVLSVRKDRVRMHVYGSLFLSDEWTERLGNLIFIRRPEK